MTPLAMKIANQLTLPVTRRTFTNERVLSLIEGDIHCFEVSAIAKPIGDAMDASNVWPDVADMLDDLFLPSPITWIECVMGESRVAYILSRDDAWWYIDMAIESASVFGGPIAKFRQCSVLTNPERVEVIRNGDENPLDELLGQSYSAGFKSATASPEYLGYVGLQEKALADPDSYRRTAVDFIRGRHGMLELDASRLRGDIADKSSEMEMLRMAMTGIGFSVLAVDLINTPGVVGFRQHQPHRGLARKLASAGVGAYPLRAWNEVTVKTHTTFDGGEYVSGSTFRKCLHFVRSHRRQYRNGLGSVVRAHWRGDPALGIKRTRYRVTEGSPA